MTDENGVVILGSVPDWKFTALRPLDENTRKAFDQTLQYNRRPSPWASRCWSDLDQGARVVRVAREGTEMASVYPVTGRFLTQARALPGTPWTITVFSHGAGRRGGPELRALIASTGAAFFGAARFHAQPAAPPPARSRA